MAQETGRLTIKLRKLNQTTPVPNATVVKTGDGGTEAKVTNSDGMCVFEIPTPPTSYSQTPRPPARPYAVCDLRIVCPGYTTVSVLGQQVFPGENSVHEIVMLTIAESRGKAEDIIVIPPHKQYVLVYDRTASTEFVPTVSSGITERRVIVPDAITVHLGPPGQTADNVTVPFPYYVKNVASSEIFPTWPEQSLRANILCIISLALNRIYTEWYRSQGYNFDITSSTAYDQYFVRDRSLFETISVIVDEIFTNYLARSGYIEPFFAEYCDGASVTCAGLSQWGTVPLARRGYNALEIVRYYYGRDIEIREAPVEENLPSFPGTLRRGDVSPDVQLLQYRLNRVAINFPAIPFIEHAEGTFGENTELSVKAFQRLFGLPETGVVDETTWYRLLYIYTAVKKLAELGSEGERVQGDEFNGRVLQVGDRGSEVLRLQYYLNSISAALGSSVVAGVAVTGVFGDDTVAAVRQFQEYYGLLPTGTVNKNTWDAIVNTYYSVGGTEQGLKPYPGRPLRRGSTGENVEFIQRALSAIHEVEPTVRSLEVDGSFGPETYAAVREFQQFYGLTVDGIVGPATWEAISLEYSRLGGNSSPVG